MSTDREFSVTRILDAPPEAVFRAWTEPDQLRWFLGESGPDEPIEVDLRVGGAWRLLMVENEHKSYVTGGVYREIVPVERLVFAWGAADGWPLLDPSRLEDSPLVTISLTSLGDRTQMVLAVRFPDQTTDDELRGWYAMGIRDGWAQTLDRLQLQLAGSQLSSG